VAHAFHTHSSFVRLINSQLPIELPPPNIRCNNPVVDRGPTQLTPAVPISNQSAATRPPATCAFGGYVRP
jgi:hypothetical protein